METPLQVQVRGLELDDRTRTYVRKRVAFKLGKHALQLTRITVQFDNVAGPKGAPTFACKFKVVLPGREVVVAATHKNARGAFDAVADAAERAVRRLLDRRRDTRKRSPVAAQS